MDCIEVGSGRTLVSLHWRRWGSDLVVHISGGRPHIGAVALVGSAAAGVVEEGVLCLSPHREDKLALQSGRQLQAALGGNVCVSAGIHLDQITRAEIAAIERSVELGVERVIEILKGG